MHSDPSRSVGFRPNGLLVLVVAVALGMGATSVIWHWKAPEYVAAARTARDHPQDLSPTERLDAWLRHGRGMVYSRLLQLRVDSKRPWLVTHVVEPSDDPSTHELWGVDLSNLSPETTRRDGMVAAVELPGVRLLGRGPLRGDKTVNVPRFRPGGVTIEPVERAEYLIEWAVESLAAALAKDIEGASLEARVGAAEPAAAEPAPGGPQ